MRFAVVDSIPELVRGKRVVAVKAVTLSEEYLADHFPTFPVLPGVLMLQVLVESATWLVREALEFEPTVILLAQARNVTYRSFVKPGNLLRVEVDCRRLSPTESEFDGAGHCNQTEVVKARFRLTHSTVARLLGGEPSSADERLREQAKAQFSQLHKRVIATAACPGA